MSNIFMHIPNLKGTASASDYKEWIAISSIHFGVNDAKGNQQSPDRVGYNLATAEMS